MGVGPVPSRESTAFTSLTPMVTTCQYHLVAVASIKVLNGGDVPLVSELKAIAEVRELDKKLD